MGKGRLEAFSDGVLAIIITIMVLELKVPHSSDLGALMKLWPIFLSYILSFVNIAIYWNNHHHMMHAVERVDARILWANMHLLFWLSMLPFTTGWMGENHFASLPMALYALDLLLCGFAYHLLQSQIIHLHGPESLLAKAVGRDWKGNMSLIAYLCAIPPALMDYNWLAGIIIVGVSLMWLIPDRRIERHLPKGQ
jgi:uncharacterized membrane protein